MSLVYLAPEIFRSARFSKRPVEKTSARSIKGETPTIMNSTIIHPTTSANESRPKPIARYITTGARILLGLVFFVFGLNGFFQFIPPPPTPMPERATAFLGAMMGAGYFLPLLAGTQTIAGALLLANRFVPLALIVLAPVIVNIIAFHLFLERSGPYHRVVGLAQGVYRVVPVEGSTELRAVPAALEGLELVAPPGQTPAARTPVPLSELRTSVQAAR